MRNPDDKDTATLAGALEAPTLKAIYVVYFGGGGLAVLYFPYFLDALGLSAAAIGLVFGGRTALAIVGQPVVSSLADRLRRPRTFIVAAFAVGVAYAMVLSRARGFAAAAAAVWISAPIMASVIPLLDAFVVRRKGVGRYGGYRLWGSVGWGVMVTVFGLLVADMEHARAGGLAVYVYAGLSAIGVLVAMGMPTGDGAPPGPRGERGTFAPGPAFVPFVLGHGLHWAACVIMNVYLSLHVRDSGMGTWVPGVAMGVAIVGEVAAFAVATRLLGRWSAGTWFVVIAVVGAARWLITAAAPSVAVVIGVQLAHFFSFGLWFSLAMQQLGRFAPPDRRTTLQGFFSAACFGVGGLLGSVAGGAVMDAFDSAAAFRLAAALEVVALGVFLVSRRVMPPPEDVEMSATSTVR